MERKEGHYKIQNINVDCFDVMPGRSVTHLTESGPGLARLGRSKFLFAVHCAVHLHEADRYPALCSSRAMWVLLGTLKQPQRCCRFPFVSRAGWFKINLWKCEADSCTA
jgi:hypothetical protein